MAERGWYRHAVRVGLFEFRRSVTDLLSSKLRLLAILAGMAFPMLGIGVVAYFVTTGAFEVGGVLGTSMPPVLRGAAAGSWLMAAFFVAQRTASARPRPPAEPLLLTTVSRRTAAVGLFVAETLRLLAYLGLPALGLAWIAYQVIGTPLALVTVTGVLVLLCASAVALGSLAGYGVVALVARFPRIARHKSLLSGAASLSFIVIYAAIQVADLGGVAVRITALVPVGGLADAALAPSRAASVPEALLGVGTAVATLVVCGVTAEWLVDHIWYRTPVSPDDGREERQDSGSGSAADGWLGSAVADSLPVVRFPAVASRSTNRVAAMAVTRTLRNPRRLSIFLFPFVGMVYGFLGGGADGPSPLWILPVGLAVAIPWVAGSAFSLNPFGDEGPVLPVTLTAVDGPSYVRGVALPGLLFGVPVSVLAVGLSGVVSPYSALQVGLLAGLAAFLTVVAAAVGPAIGVYWPRYSGFSIGQADEVLPPSMLAMICSAVAIAFPGALLALLVVAPELARTTVATVFGFLPGGLLALVAAVVGPLQGLADWFFGIGSWFGGIDVATYRTVGGPLLVAGGIAVAAISYLAAVRRFERYVPP